MIMENTLDNETKSVSTRAENQVYLNHSLIISTDKHGKRTLNSQSVCTASAFKRPSVLKVSKAETLTNETKFPCNKKYKRDLLLRDKKDKNEASSSIKCHINYDNHRTGVVEDEFANASQSPSNITTALERNDVSDNWEMIVPTQVSQTDLSSQNSSALAINVGNTVGKRRKLLSDKGKMYYNFSSVSDESGESSEIQDHDDLKIQRRSGLQLEMKVEIIKRIASGEKQSDIADEYGLNRSTLKSLLKKSDIYLKCWKNGAFHPETKRLKGAKYEDLDEVVYYWYNKSLESGSTPINGSILCTKAIQFAEKLGYKDFKASHGWLDRFKKRKGVILNKQTQKKREDATKFQDPIHSVNEVLHFQDHSNIFAVLETALLYKVLPSNIECTNADRYSGGIRSKDRFSVLFCTNMTGSERFPLVVVGKMAKSKYRQIIKISPVHYIPHTDSWFTKESIFSWLLDLDEWFNQQKRRVNIILPNCPVHEDLSQDLKCITLHHLPAICLTSLNFIIKSFKTNYRQNLLSEYNNFKRTQQMCTAAEDAEPNFTLSFYVSLLANAWQSVSEAEIMYSFQKTGIGRYGGWVADNTECFSSKLRPALLQEFSHYHVTQAGVDIDRYCHFDDNVQFCNEFTVDDMIAKVLGPVGKCAAEDSSDDEDSEQSIHGNDLQQSLHILQTYVDSLPNNVEVSNVFNHLQLLLKK